MARTIVRRGRSAAKQTSRRSDKEEFEEPEEDEDDRPSRRGGRAARRSEKATKKASSRRKKDDDDGGDDDDDEDRIHLGGGWSESERQRAKGQRDYGQRLQLEKSPHLIKFLEDGPFVSYRRHWIERPANEEGKRGKMSWPCAEEDCPLCELGDEPRFVDLFNVLDFGTLKEPLEPPENRYLETGVKLSNQIEEMNKDEKVGPINRDSLYFSVARTGDPKKISTISYRLQPVKERDLEEDWNVEVPEAEVLGQAMEDVYNADQVIGSVTRTQLREVAAEAAGEDLEVEED